MFLIVGLGNPGRKYTKTRHNLGKETVYFFAKVFHFPAFKTKKKNLAEISIGRVDKHRVILALPLVFMNESGKAVKMLITRYKLMTKNLWVIHDDLDIPLGKIKISFARSSGGHKGVDSIIKELLTKNFFRLRIGIGTPLKGKFENFVLEEFKKEEKAKIKEAKQMAIKALKLAIKESPEKAMSQYNQ